MYSCHLSIIIYKLSGWKSQMCNCVRTRFEHVQLKCQFHQHFMNIFFVQKLHAQILWTWSLALNFFGSKNWWKNLVLKFWWNWQEVEDNFPVSLYVFTAKTNSKTKQNKFFVVFLSLQITNTNYPCYLRSFKCV
jgi:hypothetical protein